MIAEIQLFGISINDILGIVVILGIFAMSFGYVISQVRRGGQQSSSDALTVAQKEVEILSEAVERREQFNKTLQQQIATLSGEVAELRKENTELRKLIMGERVPDALFKAMSRITADAHEETRLMVKAEIQSAHIELLERMAVLEDLERGETDNGK